MMSTLVSVPAAHGQQDEVPQQVGQQSCGGDAPPEASDVITLKAVGDIVIGSDWPRAYYPPGFEALVQARLRQVLGEADVIFGNVEAVLSTHGVSTKKTRPGAVYAFRMPPRFAGLLRDSGFNVTNIANNHTFDFGHVGYDDTITHLQSAGLVVTGEKDRISLQQVRGVTIAWIGFSYFARHNSINDLASVAALVARARGQADLVIVSAHAGAEGSDAIRVVDRGEIFLGENRGNVVRFARLAVDSGADLVLGHGPHVLRGLECYKGKLIAYSLGNFVGYGAFSIKQAAAVSAVLEVKLAKDRRIVAYDILPLRFDEDRLPEFDPDLRARYLVDELSALAPLNGTARLSLDPEGRASYRDWFAASGLTRYLAEPPAPRRPRR